MWPFSRRRPKAPAPASPREPKELSRAVVLRKPGVSGSFAVVKRMENDQFRFAFSNSPKVWVSFDARALEGMIDAFMHVGGEDLYAENPTLREAYERFLLVKRMSVPKIRVEEPQG